jgi:hypothetical protein
MKAHFSFAFIGACLLATAGSQAQPFFRSGVECEPLDTASESISVKAQQGIVYNASTSATASFICPVGRVQFPGSTGTLNARVADFSATANISCQVHRYDGDGVLIWSSVSVASSGSGGVPQTLPFSGVASFGFYTIRCSVPPNGGGGVSRILTYG